MRREVLRPIDAAGLSVSDICDVVDMTFGSESEWIAFHRRIQIPFDIVRSPVDSVNRQKDGSKGENW